MFEGGEPEDEGQGPEGEEQNPPVAYAVDEADGAAIPEELTLSHELGN